MGGREPYPNQIFACVTAGIRVYEDLWLFLGSCCFWLRLPTSQRFVAAEGERESYKNEKMKWNCVHKMRAWAHIYKMSSCFPLFRDEEETCLLFSHTQQTTKCERERKRIVSERQLRAAGPVFCVTGDERFLLRPVPWSLPPPPPPPPRLSSLRQDWRGGGRRSYYGAREAHTHSLNRPQHCQRDVPRPLLAFGISFVPALLPRAFFSHLFTS